MRLKKFIEPDLFEISLASNASAFGELEAHEVIMKYCQKLLFAQLFDLCRLPAMALNEFMLNRLFGTEFMPVGAFINNKRVEEAFQQELSKCRLARFLRLVSVRYSSQVICAFIMFVCYALNDISPCFLIVIIWFSHVVFLQLMDSVVTVTLSCGDVAFYSREVQP